MLMVEPVRLFAGADWVPAEIRLKQITPIPALAYEVYPDARILTGQPALEIEIPRAMLPKKRCSAQFQSRWKPWLDRDVQAGVPDAAGAKFREALRQILQPYLSDGPPSVDFAAELTGHTTRTLQRRLREAGTTFSELLIQTRMDLAQELLRNPDERIIDVAYATGYTDPSHFGRAFRSVVGISPKAYRQGLFPTNGNRDGCQAR
jgi:AraC-like DNA-binding protein